MTGLDLQSWNLEGRGRQLAWEGCSLAELARTYGTPLFVLNKNRLEDCYRNFQECFNSAGLRPRVFFSVKTNPVPDFLRQLASLGSGLEIVSDYELWLANKLAVSGDRIIVNGTWKSDKLLTEAVESDVALINIDSGTELRRLQNLAAKAGKKVNVGLRLNPGLKVSRFDFTASTGSTSSHIGLVYGSREWNDVLEILHENSNLQMRGLHFHIGSGIETLKPFDDALAAVLEVWKNVKALGFNPAVLDVGGGFGLSSAKILSVWDLVRLFGWGRTSRRSEGMRPDWDFLRELSNVYAKRLQGFSQRNGLEIPEIYVEPGRALAGPTMLLLLAVNRVLERGNGKHIAVCDAGAMSISPLLLCEYHKIVGLGEGKAHRRKYDLVGSLPTPLDIVGRGRVLPLLSDGDFVAIMDVGAYFLSQGNTFAGQRPAIVMVNNSKATLIRRRETYYDLVSRDEAV